MPREQHRVLLSDLPEWEANGWRPSMTLACGAVGVSPFSAGLVAEVLVERGVEDNDCDPPACENRVVSGVR